MVPPTQSKIGVDWPGLAAAAPAAVLVAIACGLPLAWMVATIASHPSTMQDLQLTAFRGGLLFRTLSYNAAVAILATAMSLPAAMVLGRGRGWMSRLLWAVLPAALLMPSLAFTYGWSQCVVLAGMKFVPAGPADVGRCIWTLAAWLWPVPAGVIGLALRRMDTSVQQQALLDGVLWRSTFRQLLWAVVASLAIVMLLATQEFSIYEQTGISVMATEVRMVFESGAFSSLPAAGVGSGAGAGAMSPDQAARAAAAVATAIPVLLATLLLAGAAVWAAGRAGVGEHVSVGPWPRALDAPWWTLLAGWGMVILTVGTPVLSLILSSHRPMSLARMWGETGRELTGAMFIAAIAALVAMAVALSSAARWPRGALVIGGLSFLAGGQLLAIALIRIYNRDGLTWAYHYWPVPVLAYVGRFAWLPLAAARGTTSAPWRELRAMASLDGAGPWRTARAVVWPLCWPSLAAAALLVGALSLTEVPATAILQPQKPQVLTPLILAWVHIARYDPMIEASLLMMAAVVIPAIVAAVLFHSRWRPGLISRSWYSGRGQG